MELNNYFMKLGGIATCYSDIITCCYSYKIILSVIQFLCLGLIIFGILYVFRRWHKEDKI